jgi:hypothetical protein
MFIYSGNSGNSGKILHLADDSLKVDSLNPNLCTHSYRDVLWGHELCLTVSSFVIQYRWSLVYFEEMIPLVIVTRPVDVDYTALDWRWSKISHLCSHIHTNKLIYIKLYIYNFV